MAAGLDRLGSVQSAVAGRDQLMTTILIVDDEFLIASILSFALEDEGFLTVTAGNAVNGLAMLDQEKPDLIVTDFMMPGMTGLEFAETVKSRELFRAIPILLMTGAQAHLATGRPDLFAEVLDKPFEIDLIIRRIRFHIEAQSH